MPPAAPLAMPDQDFAAPFRDPAATDAPRSRACLWRRVGVASAVLVLTAVFAGVLLHLLASNGFSADDALFAALAVVCFVGIAIAAVNAAVGAVVLMAEKRVASREPAGQGLDVALLIPTYNEAPHRVFANVVAMAHALAERDGGHRYTLFILSDTRDEAIAVAEWEQFLGLRASLPAQIPLYYRRRLENTDRKVGNIRDWCERWGGGHDAMVVLDADSVMTAAAVQCLADRLDADPATGLIQTVPHLINAPSVFGRLQAFASACYGPIFARGMAYWSGVEGNFWGHNAIIRTRAFARSAGLPRRPGRAPLGGTIMSHDFVEAALLCRAGWRVRIAPDIAGSYEECPPSLIDSVLRDRRWAQGNLQHLGLIGAAGFGLASRFHLLQGIMSYLAAPIWCLFLLVGALLHAGSDPGSAAGLPADAMVWLFGASLAVVLLPKILGLAGALAHARDWGGPGPLVASWVLEVAAAALLAPVLMVQQTLAVSRILVGVDGGWKPQRREAERTSLATLVRFHWVELVAGFVLSVAIAMGLLTAWLVPIAAGLVASVGLSALSGREFGRFRWRIRLLHTPFDLEPAAEIRAARRWAAVLGGFAVRPDRSSAEAAAPLYPAKAA